MIMNHDALSIKIYLPASDETQVILCKIETEEGLAFNGIGETPWQARLDAFEKWNAKKRLMEKGG